MFPWRKFRFGQEAIPIPIQQIEYLLGQTGQGRLRFFKTQNAIGIGVRRGKVEK